MKRLFDCANHYVQARDWKMLAYLKFCLCAIGVMLGLFVPEKHRKTALGAAAGIFLATYIPLMADFLSFALRFFRKKTENDSIPF